MQIDNNNQVICNDDQHQSETAYFVWNYPSQG